MPCAAGSIRAASSLREDGDGAAGLTPSPIARTINNRYNIVGRSALKPIPLGFFF